MVPDFAPEAVGVDPGGLGIPIMVVSVELVKYGGRWCSRSGCRMRVAFFLCVCVVGCCCILVPCFYTLFALCWWGEKWFCVVLAGVVMLISFGLCF